MAGNKTGAGAETAAKPQERARKGSETEGTADRQQLLDFFGETQHPKQLLPRSAAHIVISPHSIIDSTHPQFSLPLGP
jgi:hypothetical protein